MPSAASAATSSSSRARPARRPAGSPRRRSPRRRGRGRGTAPRWRAAAPRGPAPRARAPGRAHRGSARTRRSRRRSGSCGTLHSGDEPVPCAGKCSDSCCLVPADAEVAVPGGTEHREDLPATARATADRVHGDPVARPRVVDPRAPGRRAGGHRLVACAAGASARTSALCVPRGTTTTGQLASRSTACVTLPSSTWRAGPYAREPQTRRSTLPRERDERVGGRADHDLAGRRQVGRQQGEHLVERAARAPDRRSRSARRRDTARSRPTGCG